ncbi:hypothetical protein PIB30_070110, partial [Stylosanthes scabra]|nr:hypothetical protein [Stylosanthes scabra]
TSKENVAEAQRDTASQRLEREGHDGCRNCGSSVVDPGSPSPPVVIGSLGTKHAVSRRAEAVLTHSRRPSFPLSPTAFSHFLTDKLRRHRSCSVLLATTVNISSV